MTITSAPPDRALPPRALLVAVPATDEAADDVVTISARAFQRSQLRGRFGSILLGSGALDCSPDAQRLVAHNCAAHLAPGGRLTVNATTPSFTVDLDACGFTEMRRSGTRTIWRRTARRTIHDVIADARDALERIDADTLATELINDQATVVDIRIPDDRRRHGVIEPSLAIPRTVLEWRLDPTSGYSNPDITSFEQRIVVVCNEGYSSSLAAAALVELGYANATDLIGGLVSWIDDGLPVAPAPDDDEVFRRPAGG